MAAIGLTAYNKDVRATDPLMAALEDPVKQVQMGAVASLGELGDKRAIDVLINKLHSTNDSDIKRLILVSLGKTGEMSGEHRVIDTVFTFSHDDNSNIRHCVAIALGYLRSTLGFDCLIDLLQDPEPEVVEAALNALYELKDIRTIPFLVTILNDAQNINDLEALIALREIVIHHRIKNVEIMDLLHKLVDSKTPFVGDVAMRTLNSLGET